ncbi:winged helix-turn-helix transcriptional regulator [Ruania zhangjianzhongii]|uniref:winged helix-turn-helix transcriptional regulator n=1 Tax=Ruania zhangjianzhongii TaxID=2603206 RepID=UPI0011CB6DA0|nr:helix-turn-helix domain-containing protein [Ruania zhangjianzhongii]
MRDRSYGQFCGLAHAAELLGQRWTILVLRDLLLAPRRYSELQEGLPGIPSNGLARRLKELEADGLIVRELSEAPDRSVRYRVSERGQELIPALDALARWGAADMREPRPGEVVTAASLASALRSGIRSSTAAADRTGRTVYQVRVGDAVAHAVLEDGVVQVGVGPREDATLSLEGGPAFRDVLAGDLELADAVDRGEITAHGDHGLFEAFTATFQVPYRNANPPVEAAPSGR